jgi:hypothetical protein
VRRNPPATCLFRPTANLKLKRTACPLHSGREEEEDALCDRNSELSSDGKDPVRPWTRVGEVGSICSRCRLLNVPIARGVPLEVWNASDRVKLSRMRRSWWVPLSQPNEGDQGCYSANLVGGGATGGTMMESPDLG